MIKILKKIATGFIYFFLIFNPITILLILIVCIAWPISKLAEFAGIEW